MSCQMCPDSGPVRWGMCHVLYVQYFSGAKLRSVWILSSAEKQHLNYQDVFRISAVAWENISNPTSMIFAYIVLLQFTKINLNCKAFYLSLLKLLHMYIIWCSEDSILRL